MTKSKQLLVDVYTIVRLYDCPPELNLHDGDVWSSFTQSQFVPQAQQCEAAQYIYTDEEEWILYIFVLHDLLKVHQLLFSSLFGSIWRYRSI